MTCDVSPVAMFFFGDSNICALLSLISLFLSLRDANLMCFLFHFLQLCWVCLLLAQISGHCIETCGVETSLKFAHHKLLASIQVSKHHELNKVGLIKCTIWNPIIDCPPFKWVGYQQLVQTTIFDNSKMKLQYKFCVDSI